MDTPIKATAAIKTSLRIPVVNSKGPKLSDRNAGRMRIVFDLVRLRDAKGEF